MRIYWANNMNRSFFVLSELHFSVNRIWSYIVTLVVCYCFSFSSVAVTLAQDRILSKKELKRLTEAALPNHLSPISPYQSDTYDSVVYSALIGGIDAEIWMLVKPTRAKEYAVIISRKKAGDVSEWFIERVEPQKMIWLEQMKAQNNLSQKEINLVSKTVRKIDKEKYKTIVKAWRKSIEEVRYPKSRFLSRDGITYQFYADYSYFGEAVSPKKGVPLKMVKLGNLLEKLVHTSNDEELLAEANKISKEILEIYQDSP